MKEQLMLAVEFALLKHEGQLYGKHPYVYHLIQVDKLVVQAYAKTHKQGEQYSKHPGDEIDCLRAISYIHDVIEDCGVTTDELRAFGFCEVVVQAVLYMSKSGEPYKDYIEGVKSNEFARKVKLCDTSANLMNSIQEGNTKRINKYSKQIQLLGGF